MDIEVSEALGWIYVKLIDVDLRKSDVNLRKTRVLVYKEMGGFTRVLVRLRSEANIYGSQWEFTKYGVDLRGFCGFTKCLLKLRPYCLGRKQKTGTTKTGETKTGTTKRGETKTGES